MYNTILILIIIRKGNIILDVLISSSSFSSFKAKPGAKNKIKVGMNISIIMTIMTVMVVKITMIFPANFFASSKNFSLINFE